MQTIAQQNAKIEEVLSLPGLGICRFECAGWAVSTVCGGQEGCELLILTQGEMQFGLATGETVRVVPQEILVVTPEIRVCSAHMCSQKVQGTVMAFARGLTWKRLPCGQEKDRAGGRRPEREGPYRDRYQMDRIRRVQAYMLENLDQPHTIQGLSEAFHISSTLLKEGFRQMYGLPIHKFLQVHRMARAAELLCTTGLPVLQIAEAVGYDSASQFGVIFKRQYQLSPSQYRKRLGYKMSKTVEFRPNRREMP